MNGRVLSGPERWGAKEWAMTALAFVVMCSVALFATRGLAWGAQGDVGGCGGWLRGLS